MLLTIYHQSWIPLSFSRISGEPRRGQIFCYNLVCSWKKRRKWLDYLVSVGIHTFNKRCSMNQSVHVDYRGLFRGHCPLLNHGSQLIRRFKESFQQTFNQGFCIFDTFIGKAAIIQQIHLHVELMKIDQN